MWYMQMKNGTSYTQSRKKIRNMDFGRPKGMPMRYVQALPSLAGELHLNFTKAKPFMDKELIGIFLSSGTSPNHETQHKLGGAAIAGSTTGQGCMSESQARNKDDYTGPLAAAGELPHGFVENVVDDYLELDDLLGEPESRCSSLDNTSSLTLTSDEYFDSLALMQELEDEIDRNKQQQGKNANFKFCIAAASGEPNKVVMHPATLGSLLSSNGSKLPAEAENKKLPDRRIPERVIKIEKTHDGKEGTSKSPSGNIIIR
ncbi:hypothetical protein HYC85_020899 [Camellia sinensis]|uniref:Uncharacterized protein n=1 Tax=Camellia sinensis TaxID=4442 RepID=A0A7J7GS36_CAMSI|nr:hypothetical protein HYC85_020899 [Camellia sinensis]